MTQKEVLTHLYENMKKRFEEDKNVSQTTQYERFALLYQMEFLLKKCDNGNYKNKNTDEETIEYYLLFMKMVDKIIKDNFDISDFYAYEHPCAEVYCFCNMDETKFFDLHYFYTNSFETDVIASYIEKTDTMQNTDTIQEAIEKYVPWKNTRK